MEQSFPVMQSARDPGEKRAREISPIAISEG